MAEETVTLRIIWRNFLLAVWRFFEVYSELPSQNG